MAETPHSYDLSCSSDKDALFGGLALHHVYAPDSNGILDAIQELLKAIGHVSVGRKRGGKVTPGARHPFNFPGPLPCSMYRTDIADQLLTRPYAAAEKTDGERALLFCTTYESLRVCCLINRGGSVYLAPLKQLPTAFFQGTLLDGELVNVKNSSDHHFLVFDVFAVSGVRLVNAPFMRRMECFQKALAKYYAPLPGDPFVLMAKVFFPMPLLPSAAFSEHCLRVGGVYEVDGFVFQPLAEQLGTGRQRTLLKLKSKGNHTVDFCCGQDCASLSVWDFHQKCSVVVGRLDESAPEVARGCVLECELVSEGVWRCVRARPEKKHANDRETFEATMVNIRENVTLMEIIDRIQEKGLA